MSALGRCPRGDPWPGRTRKVSRRPAGDLRQGRARRRLLASSGPRIQPRSPRRSPAPPRSRIPSPPERHSDTLSARVAPEEDEVRKLLPLIGLPSHPGGRSAMTCRYRCGDACFHEVPEHQRQRVRRRRHRRRAVAPFDAARRRRRDRRRRGRRRGDRRRRHRRPRPQAAAAGGRRGRGKGQPGARGLRFAPVAPNTADAVTVPEGYAQNVVIRWGEPDPARRARLRPGQADREGAGRAVRLQQRLPAAAAAAGRAAAGSCWSPTTSTPTRVLMFARLRRRTTRPASRPRSPGPRTACPSWSSRRSGAAASSPPSPGTALNRRITATTPFEVTGPAAGSDLLKTSADPTGTKVLGTLNNCAGGITPWGTMLSRRGELQPVLRQRRAGHRPTRPHGSSGTASPAAQPSASGSGSTSASTSRRSRTRSHRFGWVVELDPYDPDSTPRKHTALGRFKHEAATAAADRRRPARRLHGRRRAVRLLLQVRLPQADEAAATAAAAREHNLHAARRGHAVRRQAHRRQPGREIDGTGKLPDDGEFDGSGEWIPLATRRHARTSRA